MYSLLDLKAPYPLRGMLHIATAVSALTLAACSTPGASTFTSDSPGSYAWLTGCWQTADGVEETWVQSRQGDQLFGYSVVSQGNERVFFEQLRIDITGDTAVLHAYPKGIGPTPFQGSLTGPHSAVFVNPDNDFPQRIRYSLEGRVLNADIANMANTKTAAWSYQRCAP